MKKLLIIFLLVSAISHADKVQDALKINDQAKTIQVLKEDKKELEGQKNWEGTQKNISIFINGVLAVLWIIK